MSEPISLSTLESEAHNKGFKSLGAYVDYCLKEYGSWDPTEVRTDENMGSL